MESPETTESQPEIIDFETFQRMDLRVGIVRKAEPIPKSNKLVKLTVDIGEERTVGPFLDIELALGCRAIVCVAGKV